ncbi:MAG: hypothetical protein CMH98_09940 [Oceanospirillaceae bacterium]|nr:hypothetical protein [Oceanospirillaceae bacterium]
MILNYLRALIALLSFFLGGYLLFDLLLAGFHWRGMVVALLCFVASHYLWPRGQGMMESDTLQIVADIIDLPYRLIALILRGVVRLGKSADDLGGIN